MIISEYDLRGIFEKEITPIIVEEAFQGFLKFLKQPKKILLANDCNQRSLYLKDFILKNFNHIEYLGTLPTPIFYYYVLKRKIPGVIITASHLPVKYVGLKFLLKDGTSWKPKIEKKLKSNYRFEKTNESFEINKELYEEYFEKLKEIIKEHSSKPLKLNFDLRNFFLKTSLPYFKKFNIQHSPNSEIKVKADLDNDRIFIFRKNKQIPPDLIFYYLALNDKYQNLGVPIYFSKFLEKKLIDQGKKIFYIQTGHIHFKEAYKKFNLDLAFEPSGHFYMFKDLKTEAPYLALILFLLKFSNLNLLNLNIYRFNLKIAPSFSLEKIVNSLKKKFGLKLKKFDGYLLYNQNFYLHLRKSKTENKLRISYEGLNNFLKEIKKWLAKKL